MTTPALIEQHCAKEADQLLREALAIARGESSVEPTGHHLKALGKFNAELLAALKLADYRLLFLVVRQSGEERETTYKIHNNVSPVIRKAEETSRA